jgi:hypothetical protein
MEPCEHCKQEHDGNFCPNCGESRGHKRLTLNIMLFDFFGSFFSYDSGFNKTMHLLFVDPGKLIHDYLNGIRKPYFHPIRLILIFATINALLFVQLDLLETVAPVDPTDENQKIIMTYMQAIMGRYMNLFSMAIVPFLALMAMLFFRKSKYSYGEHFLIFTYLYAMVLFLGILATPFQVFFPKAIVLHSVLGFGLTVVYLLYGLLSVYKPSVRNVFAGIFTYFTGFFVYIIAFMIVIGFQVYSDYQSGNLELPSKHRVKNNLSGGWTLHSMDLFNDSLNTYEPFLGGMQGNLVYDGKGHMSVQLQSADYNAFEGEVNNFTERNSMDALKHLTKNYGYSGTYVLLEGDTVIEHHRVFHSDPGDAGSIVQRRISYSSDTLTLQPLEEQNAGFRLKWVKQK